MNIVVLTSLCSIGFLVYLIFDDFSGKTIGDHCEHTEDCESNMNFVCSNYVCSCPTGTFLTRTGAPCGKSNIYYFNFINWNRNMIF